MIYRFADFELDSRRLRLRQGDRPVVIEPKPLSLLLYLVENRARIVPSEELLAHVWPDVHVSNGSLPRCVWSVRRALRDDSTRQAFIRTVRGRGYRFVGHVLAVPDEEDEASSSTSVGRKAEIARATALLGGVSEPRRAGAPVERRRRHREDGPAASNRRDRGAVRFRCMRRPLPRGAGGPGLLAVDGDPPFPGRAGRP
jgi:DNA-binding winged helix-turn-helix (wHTH) protein